MPQDSFIEFVLDQLRELPNVRVRSMFGGHGLYCGEQFFGILDEGRLFFKTNTQSQKEYVDRHMSPFTYKVKGKTVTLGFHEVPPDVLENTPELIDGARRSLRVAVAAK